MKSLKMWTIREQAENYTDAVTHLEGFYSLVLRKAIREREIVSKALEVNEIET